MVPGNNIFACTDRPRGRVLYACFRRKLSSVFPPSKSSRSLRVALSMLKLVQNRQAKRCGSRLAAHTQHMVARASYHIYMVHATHTRERKRSPPIPLLALSFSLSAAKFLLEAVLRWLLTTSVASLSFGCSPFQLMCDIFPSLSTWKNL